MDQPPSVQTPPTSTTEETRWAAENAGRIQQYEGVRRTGPGRKPRACVECKKQKMKCEVLPGDTKCTNCLRRNISSCIFKRVMMAETSSDLNSTDSARSYERKIDSMTEEIRRMRESLDMLIRQGTAVSKPERPPAIGLQNQVTVESGSSPAITARPPGEEDNMRMAMTRENSPDPARNGEQSTGGSVNVEEPMGSLYEVTRLRNIRSNQAKTARPQARGNRELNDFISRGVISLSEAEDLYRSFHTSLNHYLWVGLEQTHPSFEAIRQSSELLTATILTVTALHIPTSAETFDQCYKEFLALTSSSMFSRYHSIDDVRALCIAAFWLSEVSWKLSGHAIRIATELNVHQSFSRALEGDKEHFLRARLWYMLYVCDHHFSIAYGRPPMIAESLQIREHELFLQSPFADALDRRILSQVALMQILTRVYDRFVERKVPHQDYSTAGAMLSDDEGGEDFADLRNFNLEIDQWRMRWNARQENNRFIGSFPPKGIILYSYFAKLQLNALAIRGVSLSQGRLSTERKEFANMAISAAASILTFVLEEEDMRRALVGTPLYVHTMIAFASVFLMKVATKWNRIMGLNVESNYVSHLLERMIVLLKSSVTSERHLLYHIASGLEKMLENLGRISRGPPKQVDENMGVGVSPESVISFGPMGYGTSPGNQAPAVDNQNHGFATGEGLSWDSYTAGAGPRHNFLDDLAVMNDSLIYEAFGSDSANDVYNLLNSQFSY
ncbi:Uu.00g094900.m01.CDS01 [Anthostomella pinea]|uniref:Uu.00g094900.m01.CDS01 n=1 Tax=Anthostomella pinea TaxID=933095 RepID=A0AAI8VNQ2_9PEZI|nr:Uu.00g094900.m01.CDS01 [Anthostomella pinea]